MQKKQELVSIIIPTYNAEKSIVRCINSVVNQTYRNVEIIVINDGSTDKTLELLEKIKCEHSNINVINKRNEGVSKARNDGISNAKGKYIYFADSDDYISENTISEMVEAQEKSGAELILCGFDYITKRDGHTNVVYFEDYWEKSVKEYLELISEKLHSLYYGALWNKLYIREILVNNQIYFDKEISYAEDFMFNIEYLKHIERIVHIPKVLYYYDATDESSLSRKKHNANKLWEISKIRIKIYIEECEKYKLNQCINRAYELMAMELMGPLNFITKTKLSKKEKECLYGEILRDPDAVESLKRSNNLNMTLKMAKRAALNGNISLLRRKLRILMSFKKKYE